MLFVVAAIALGAYFFGPGVYRAIIPKRPAQRGETPNELAAQSVKLTDKQATAIKVAPVAYRDFQIEKTSVGNIDFNDDKSVQVFASNPGRIIAAFAGLGDEVKAGETLFTIDSPDLLQAESTLIQTAGVLQLTNRALARTQKLVKITGAAQKDLDQAISDQQTAEGNFKSARDAVRVFGKNDSEIDRIMTDRRVDSSLFVRCPITGVITSRNAAPGLFVQPGAAPAPFSVADISTMVMSSFLVESEIPGVALGQEVEAKVLVYPDRIFEGHVTALGTIVDPATRRLLVRSEIKNPDHFLRPGMFATFVIRAGKPIHSLAIPLAGIVREGDGTMSAWVTQDGSVFTRRTVRLGLQQNGYHQVLDGVQAGETAVTDGAIFLSNMLASGATD